MGNTKAETIAKTCQSTFPVSEFTGVVVDSPGFDVTLGIGEMDEPVFIQTRILELAVEALPLLSG